MTVTAADDLAQRLRAGDTRAGARLMTWAERGDRRYAETVEPLAEQLGDALRVGITGPPGAGKSTLVQGLVQAWRRQGRTLGVVAVDPSSPFTGGALLGDRVRMSELALDSGVFIRSMATRGEFGGLARATDDVADVLDLMGRDVVLLETVGVGQSEVEVARSADLTLVVLHPGAGDTIQAMKAGLLEAADLYVIHKDDLPGADRLADELAEALDLRSSTTPRPPVLAASSLAGRGVVELAAAIDALAAAARDDGRLAVRRRDNLARRVRRLVQAELLASAWNDGHLETRLARLLSQGGTLSAHALARQLLSSLERPGFEEHDR